MSSLEPPVGETALPRWFTVALTGALVFVATAGLTGIALLVLRAYEPLLVWALAAGAAVVSAVAVARVAGTNAVEAHGPAIAAVAVAVIFLAMTGALHSEHLLTERDPGVYVNTGRSIAGTQTLTPNIRAGPFENPKFVVFSPGFPERSGKQQTWFLPMLGVLFALGWSAGGYAGLFVVAPILGALGLLVCYALSARLVGPRWALLAPALLAINPLQSWFARDGYSELVVQVVALGGIWLYLEARASVSPGIAAISGALVATSVLARFDALAVVAALVGFAALDWTRSDDAERPEAMRRVVSAFGLVLVGLTLYCTLVTYATSRAYLDHHDTSTRPLQLLLLGVIALAMVWILGHRLRPGFGRRLAQARATFAIIAALVLAVLVWSYIWRPANAQWSWSLRWFVDWFGILAVALAVFGLLLLGRRALRGDVVATAVVMVVAPLAVLYLARATASPDQPWVMRRFLPVVIPGVAIAVAAMLHGLTGFARRVGSRRRRLAAFLVVVALTGAVIAQSAVSAAPLVGARAQHGALTAVKTLCRDLPSDAAVLIYPASYLDNEMTQTIRGFCEVPTARDPVDPDLDIAALARAWGAAGRRLYIVTASPETIERRSGAVVVAHLRIDDRYEPQHTYRTRPHRYAPQPRQFWLLRVAPKR